MRVGIFYYGTEAKNRGLGQLSESLIALGHEPLIVTRSPKSGKMVRQFNNTSVIQIPLSPSHCSYIASTPLPFNPFWKRWTVYLCRKYGLQGIFVREIPVSWQIIAAAKKLRVPVFLDLRENLGAAYAAGNKKKWIRRIFRQRKFVNLYESLVVPRFEHVFTSTDELGLWLTRNYRIKPSSLSTLGNYPSQIFLDQAEVALKNKNKEKRNGAIRLVHVGYVLQNRGIQDIVKALSILIERGINIVFRIIGEGPYLNDIKRLVYREGMEENVEFVAMLPPENVAEALAICDIGVCAYLLNEQTHQTLPGKLFEYMAVGVPVLSSPRRTVIPIIKQNDCGVIYNSRKPELIAESILRLIADRKQMHEMGRKGREAVLKRYNWKVNLDTLEKVLEEDYSVKSKRVTS